MTNIIMPPEKKPVIELKEAQERKENAEKQAQEDQIKQDFAKQEMQRLMSLANEVLQLIVANTRNPIEGAGVLAVVQARLCIPMNADLLTGGG